MIYKNTNDEGALESHPREEEEEECQGGMQNTVENNNWDGETSNSIMFGNQLLKEEGKENKIYKIGLNKSFLKRSVLMLADINASPLKMYYDDDYQDDLIILQ